MPSEPSPIDPEREWLEKVYKGGIRQLTARAVVSGMLLGALLCLSNLYVVLKTGWSFGVTITASILAFALFRGLGALRVVKEPLTLLENGAVASVASSAGYMTGGGNMAALPALLLLTGARPTSWTMVIWFGAIAMLGAFAAIPIKRQLVNIEKLAFPTGTATAETLQSMHASKSAAGGGEGADKSRLLGRAGIIGALVAWMRDAKASWMPFHLPGSFGLPFSIAGLPASAWTLSFDASLLLIGGGALMSFKTGWSLLLGAIATYAILAPKMVALGAITTVSYKGIVAFMVWPGAALLVSSGLLSFAFQWRSIVRSFSGLAAFFSRTKRAAADDPVAAVECPGWWFPAGFAVLGPVVIVLMAYLFGIPWWAGVIAVPLAVVMGVVAARVTGETDTTPTKALGPITQAVFGALVPGNLPANIMSANVTGGVGLHAADMCTDLKCGYLVGAAPRQQLIGQLFGAVAGSLAVVPAFNLLVPTADVIGSTQFPAPSALVWAGVSKVLVDGIEGLAPASRIALVVGASVGIVLVLVERWAPRSWQKYIPSPSGVGIAMVIPGSNSIAFFLGATMAEILRRVRPNVAERSVTPIASGFIAGESLMGILVAVLVAFGILTK